VRSQRLALSLSMMAVVSACAIGPRYERPKVELPKAFKEIWSLATPMDDVPKGDWWSLYNDTTLNALEARAAKANNTLLAAQATYDASHALLVQAGLALLPTATVNASNSRARSSPAGVTPGTNVIASTYTTDRLTASSSWEVDLWGQVRQGLYQTHATVQSARYTLQNAQLSLQATLAQTYIQLAQNDQQRALLRTTLTAYQRSLDITENRYKAGVAQRTDVTQARSQLANTQAQLADLNITRAQLEHAIAVLVGELPENFALPERVSMPTLPALPRAVPSTVLQRRPDIAASERKVAAANYAIGVAITAFFPTITLTGTSGYQANAWQNLQSAPHKLWSLGPQAAFSLLDSGTHEANLLSARANYRGAVANYRQTVLSAFQDVDDQLVALSGLSAELSADEQAAQAATETLTATNNQYRAGTVSYLNVVVAESTQLSAQTARITAQSRLLQAHVALIKALGGGLVAPEPEASTPARQ
jgi:NodT family efflux transporter outer membrane factor (OMF) lipoprotein